MPTKRTPRRNSIAIQFAVPRRGVPSAVAVGNGPPAASPAGKVTLRIVGRREGRTLNRRFRKRDRATNVLSFSYGRSGDVVLCHPVIAREAHAQRKSVQAHYAHLVVHGVLHLRGHRHHDKASARTMEAREIRILRRIGFADPYTVE